MTVTGAQAGNDREAITLFEALMEEPALHALSAGQVAAFSTRSPAKGTPNEDSAAVQPVDAKRLVLIAADGVGGLPAGHQASRVAVETLCASIREAAGDPNLLRESILEGFERANRAVIGLGVGAATTLAAAEVDDGTVRIYHVGDSLGLLFGGRGKVKLQTIDHSPVGYAVEAGLLDEKDAMVHEHRHLVSNVLGDTAMRVDMSAPVHLSQRDTLVIASDGLSDNLGKEEIVEHLRRGPLDRGCAEIVRECRRRMLAGDDRRPGKADDLTLLAYRPPRRAKR